MKGTTPLPLPKLFEALADVRVSGDQPFMLGLGGSIVLAPSMKVESGVSRRCRFYRFYRLARNP